MIQFNLLPDIKLEYIRAQRLKRTVISISLIIVVASIVVLILLAGTVYGFQRKHINDLTEDISKTEQDIKDIDQINRLLTVQNQLRSINDLHEQKPVSSRFFTFIERLTPTDININRVEVDFEASTMKITGAGSNLASVNKFADTLKFTEYAIAEESDVTDSDSSDEESEGPAFSGVVLSSFDRSKEGVSYVIDLSFNPQIFVSNSEILLIIRDKITTRSELEKPGLPESDSLFRGPIEEDL
ncbi:hypothetical protein BH23PAT2_BH23PAT2_03110 [soil metagenome]